MATFSEANIRDLTLIMLWRLCSARLAFLGKITQFELENVHKKP